MGIHKNKMKKMKSGGSANKSTFYAIGGMLDKKISSSNNMMKYGGSMLAAMNIKKKKA